MNNSSYFRNNFKEEYNKLIEIDKQCRKKYVNYICDFFESNEKIMYDFCYDILNKGNKAVPDYIFTFNHETLKSNIITKEQILNNVSNQLIKKDLGFLIGNIKFQIGWQNGSGLNNPTLRVFL